MSAHVLVNVLNEFGKRIKMRGLPSILSIFRNDLNKFNKTWSTNVRFYLSYDIRIILNSYFWRKTLGFCHIMRVVKSIVP